TAIDPNSRIATGSAEQRALMSVAVDAVAVIAPPGQHAREGGIAPTAPVWGKFPNPIPNRAARTQQSGGAVVSLSDRADCAKARFLPSCRCHRCSTPVTTRDLRKDHVASSMYQLLASAA